MTFRVLFALLIGIALAVLFVLVVGSILLLRMQVGALFPEELALEADGALQMLFAGQAIALLIFSVLISGAVFWVIAEMVAKPLRQLVAAMDTYATTGQHIEVPDVAGAPIEIQSLAQSFQVFMTNAEESHKRDTEISRVKSDFISTAAHQFRTPLTGIRWALEALQKETLTESQKALVASAVDKSHDLVGIVGTLLDISAIESGKYKYSFQPTDMQQIAAGLAQDFAQAAAAKQIALAFHQDEEVIPPARADHDRVKWVLNNLVDNALQYTPSGGSVTITVSSSDKRVFVRVKDTGIGIPENDRGNIFERFYRAPNAIAKENKGNGLGLYIARTIATDHGGDLSFAPNEGGTGTTFTLALPVAG